MSEQSSIVIVGGGHAGAQLCGALAAAGKKSGVHLVCEESVLPYHRPPLSKAFLKNPATNIQPHRQAAWFAEAGVTLHQGDAAVSIDRKERVVKLHSGKTLKYDFLVLATGANARKLPHLHGELSNVAVLRTESDATRLRSLLDTAKKLTVIGGGYIGLEIAATAAGLGKSVKVLESAPRLLMRTASPEISNHIRDVHAAQGVDIHLAVSVGEFEIAGGRLQKLSMNGKAEDVDLVVQGVGAVPEHTLATEAGLECENGIVVNEFMQTSDPAILAIGDCTNFPEAVTGRRLRLESVQNAMDQAKTASATMLGAPTPYKAVPTFWSDQGNLRLQVAGLIPAEGKSYKRPGATPESFSMLHFAEGRLVCVESVNSPPDHMGARKVLQAGGNIAPERACDPSAPLA